MRKLLVAGLKPNNKISKQLFRSILSWYFILAVTITVIQLGVEFYNEKEDLSVQIDSISQTLMPSVSEALWNYDEDQIQATLRGFYKNQEIYGIAIQPSNKSIPAYRVGYYLDDGVRRFNADVEQSVDGSNTASTQFIDMLYVKSYVLLSPEEPPVPLGSMQLFYSSNTVIERTYKTFITTILMAFIKTIGLWILAVNIINRVVARPIERLQKDVIHLDIDEANRDEYSPPSEKDLSGFNEIQYLRACFEALKVELSNKNVLIENNTATLEKSVFEKTQELSLALEELTRASQVKSEFLANISHELRTPLNSIIGFTNRILVKYSDELNDRIIDSVSTVHSNGTHLLSLVNDLLDISKIEAGEMELNFETVNLETVLKSVSDTTRSLAKEKQLILEVDPACVETITADQQRVTQILLNLLSNAIKFSDKGRVKLENVRANKNGVEGLELRVVDQGAGIPKESLPLLFDRFKQVGDINNASPGTGLGLAIAKELMALHGGDIRAESELGVGSQFILWLPLKR